MGYGLTAKPNGDLLLQGDQAGKVKLPFKKGEYRYGYVRKPRGVELLEKAFQAGKYDVVLKAAPGVF